MEQNLFMQAIKGAVSVLLTIALGLLQANCSIYYKFVYQAITTYNMPTIVSVTQPNLDNTTIISARDW